MGRAAQDWDTSCPDWQARLLAGKSLVPTLPLFEDQAEQAVKIFNLLRLPDVSGQPRLGDVGGAWFLDIVRALFGSYDEQINKRYISELFLLVPKKNAKSTNAAAMMVTALLMNTRPNAEFTFIAPTIEIAAISFRQARGMIRAEPVLAKKSHIQDNFKRITWKDTDSYLQIKTADLDVVTGVKSVGILVDETHVFASHSRAADIFVEIRGALAAKEDGFLINISTQSKTPPAGQFKAELERARDVRDGRLVLPKALLPVIYELPRDLATQWDDEKYWDRLNPNLGKSVSREFLRNGIINARRDGPGSTALFASQHFNVEIGQALRADGWPGAEFWEKQTDPTLTLERLLERSEIVVVGVDGGGIDDLFAICTLGRCRETKHWLCWSHAWCHESTLQRRQTIAATLQDFKAAGELTIVSDRLDDISSILDIIKQIKSKNKLAAVAVDPSGIGAFVDALASIQITPDNKKVIGVGQGYQMMNAIKSTERKLVNGTLWHGKSELMRWCVGNIKIEPTATAIRATKANAGDAKIDAAMALFDAATVMSSAPESAPSYRIDFI